MIINKISRPSLYIAAAVSRACQNLALDGG